MSGSQPSARRQVVRIIVVHGRGSKPSYRCKLGYVREVLTESVRRVAPSAGRWLARHPQAIQLAYYADLIRNLTQEPIEACANFREPIDRLYHESRSCPTWLTFRGLMLDLGADATVLMERWFQRSTRKRLLATQLRDVMRYFRDHAFASSIRQRLQRLLVPALRRRERVLLLAHSLGSVIAYDVLWKLSHMSEYAAVRHRKVECFMTMGSPLGDKVLKTHLLGWRYPTPQRYPMNIRRWANFSARGDVVCHDKRLADDFWPMLRAGDVERLEEYPNLCTVYRSRDGEWNPHKLYGYLILPELGRLVAAAIQGAGS